MVVSPLASTTSPIAFASHSCSLRTAEILSISCGSTISPIPEGRSVPIEGALLPEEDVTDKQNYNVDQHLHKTEDPEFVVNECPGVKKNGFDIKQDKDQSHHVKMYGKRLPRVSHGGNSAFIRHILFARVFVTPDCSGGNHQHSG